MKRSEAIKKLFEFLKTYQDCKLDEAVAEKVLNQLEEIGMRPPHVDRETTQALYQVYMWPDVAQWDEDVEKDAKVMEAKQKRAERRTKKIQS